MTNGLLDRFGTNGGGSGIGPGVGGSGAQVNLFSALSGQLNQTKQQDMVKLTTNDPAPYYMRFGVADKVTENGFSARPPADGVEATGPLPDPAVHVNGVTQQRYTATVQILNLNMSLLPIYTQPVKIQKLGGTWFYDRVSGLLYSSRETSSGRQYTFDFLHTDFSPAALRTSRPLSPNDELQRLNTQVPDLQFVNDLVASLTKDKATVYDKVRALFDYFSSDNKFTYALTTKSGTSGSDIVDFLTNKQGYCEQYASALAWLVRAAHIPARVAFGFTRGGIRDRDTFTLTNYNLHAWTEVYFAGFGWVPFDATPVSNIAGAVSPVWAPDINHKDSTGDAGAAPINPNSASSQTDQGRNPNDAEGKSTVGPGAQKARTPTWPYWAVGSALLLLLVLAAPSARRATLRRRRRPKAAHARAEGPPMDISVEVPGQMRVVEVALDADTARSDAHAAWDELIDTLVDYRIPLDDAETPRVTAERIATLLRLRPDAADGVRRLGFAEERARYSKVPLAAGGLAAALRTARAAIARRATRWTRIRAVLLPPSVLFRWGDGLVAGANATATAVGRRRDAVLRAIRPRRLLFVGRTGRGSGPS
jgi:transglutaminase-like putative cysteine protease